MQILLIFGDLYPTCLSRVNHNTSESGAEYRSRTYDLRFRRPAVIQYLQGFQSNRLSHGGVFYPLVCWPCMGFYPTQSQQFVASYAMR